jgi:hypothetical protein
VAEKTRFSTGSIGKILTEEFGDAARVERALRAAGVNPNEIFREDDGRPSHKEVTQEEQRALIEHMRKTITVKWDKSHWRGTIRPRVSDYLRQFMIEPGIWDHPAFSMYVLRKYDPNLASAYDSATLPEALKERPLDNLYLDNHGRKKKCSLEDREAAWARDAHLQPPEKPHVPKDQRQREASQRYRDRKRGSGGGITP